MRRYLAWLGLGLGLAVAGVLTGADLNLLGRDAVAQVVPAAKAITEGELRRSGVELIDRAYVLEPAVWRRPSIYVCWENAGPQHAEAQGWVRAAAADTWEKESAVRFKGWPACSASSIGVRINVTGGASYTEGLGTQLDSPTPCGGVPRGPPCRVHMNLDVASWPPGTCEVSPETCIKAMAAHELGHVLALAHEQNSPRAPFECSVRRSGPNGDLPLTPFDPDSVMNYCRPTYNTPVKLSAGDILFARKFYGNPHQ